MKKLGLITLLILLATLFFATPVLASYYASLVVIETDGNDYVQLPLIYSIDVDYLVDNHYITSTGLDTRVTAPSGTPFPHMVADDKVLFITDFDAYSQKNLIFTTGSTPWGNFPIITGYGGYITVSDAAGLELGNNFEIETNGYIASTSVGEIITYKEAAFRTYVSASTEITSEILTTTTPAAIYNPDSGNYDDGFMESQDNTYYTARNATTADDIYLDAVTGDLGQRFVDPAYIIDRLYLYFDTSGIPDNAEVIAATVSLYGSADNSVTDFDIVVTSGMATYPSTPLVTTDFDYTFYPTNCGSLSTASFSAAGYNDITLNSTGEGLINLTGYTKFCVMSSRDIAGTTPTGDEYVQVALADTGGTANDPKLVVTYQTAAKSVTATGVTTAEHTIKTTADGTDLKIYIDSIEEDSVALVGTSVSDNGNDWVILGDSLPYANYYKHTVSSTLIAWYQPAAIIDGTTLPDREGTAQNGVITWGSNPSGFSIMLGELISYSQPLPEGATGEGGSNDMTGESGQPDWAGSLPTLATNPLYPVVSMIADTTHIPVGLVWILGATFLLMAAVLLCFRYVPHQLITAFVGEGMTIFFWQLGIYPFWTIFVFALGALAIVLYERMPSV